MLMTNQAERQSSNQKHSKATKTELSSLLLLANENVAELAVWLVKLQYFRCGIGSSLDSASSRRQL